MAKVDVPCALKKIVRYVTLTYHTIRLRKLLTCSALERRRPDTIPETLRRFSTIDIIEMSTF